MPRLADSEKPPAKPPHSLPKAEIMAAPLSVAVVRELPRTQPPARADLGALDCPVLRLLSRRFVLLSRKGAVVISHENGLVLITLSADVSEVIALDVPVRSCQACQAQTQGLFLAHYTPRQCHRRAQLLTDFLSVSVGIISTVRFNEKSSF